MIFLCLHFPVESYHIVLLSNILDFVPCNLQLQRPTAAFDIPLAPAAHCLDGRLGGGGGEGFLGVYERHGEFFGSRKKHGFWGEGGVYFSSSQINNNKRNLLLVWDLGGMLRT